MKELQNQNTKRLVVAFIHVINRNHSFVNTSVEQMLSLVNINVCAFDRLQKITKKVGISGYHFTNKLRIFMIRKLV